MEFFQLCFLKERNFKTLRKKQLVYRNKKGEDVNLPFIIPLKFLLYLLTLQLQ